MNLNTYQLSRSLSKQQIVSLGLFKDGKRDNNTKYLIFFNGIHNGTIKCDEDAITQLKYKNVSAFNKFKERYNNKVLDYLLLSEARVGFKDSSKDLYFKLHKLYVCATLLRYRNDKENSHKLFQYVFNLSLKHDFEDLIIFSARPLKQYFAFVEPDHKLFKYYTNIINRWKKSFDRTLNLFDKYDDISHKNLILPASQIDTFNKETLETATELINGIKEDDSFEYKSRTYELASFAFNINKEFKKSINISTKSIELAETKFKTTENPYVLIALKDILSSYLKLKDIENAKVTINKILSITKTHNQRYFRNKGLEFTLYASTKEFNKLHQITNHVISLRKLKDYRILLEEWNIRSAFVNILVEAGSIDKSTLEASPTKKFRLNKFVNDVQFYSKDKRGTNISILIVQLIHFLIRKEYDKITERLDALNQYTHRYLRNDASLRSNCFIKMLLKLPEAEYNPIRTQRYVAKYEKKLAENPYEVSLKEISVEIIPYEYLWEIILEILDTNLKKK